MAKLPPITVETLKAAGLVCWRIDFAGPICSKLHEQGYTFDQAVAALNHYAYQSHDSGAIMYRLRPTYDPESVVCPVCDNPEIVMVPQKGGGWRCPKCGHVLPEGDHHEGA